MMLRKPRVLPSEDNSLKEETIINLPKLNRKDKRKYLLPKENKFSTRALKLISQ